MKITNIDLSDFRNIENLNFDISQKFIIKGSNGTGKTSVLEACNILLSGRSFRTSDIKDCIKNGKKSFFIKCRVIDFEGFLREISIGYDISGNRRILIDGINSSRKELVNIVFPIVHTPADMEIISGGPKSRRDFIDRICFMENREYFDDMTSYIRFIRQKNAALKKKAHKTVRYLNQAAIPIIEKIRKKRNDAIDLINKKVYTLFDDLLFGNSVVFQTFADENIEEKFELKLEKEILKGFSLYGPHLDSLNIQINKRNNKNSGSMGETYLLSFLLKLSELLIYEDKNLHPPVFIDDVFVFLDESRKKELLKKIVELKNQVIMTSSAQDICENRLIHEFDIEKNL
jgi:DNA replication and repair protein RecF